MFHSVQSPLIAGAIGTLEAREMDMLKPTNPRPAMTSLPRFFRGGTTKSSAPLVMDTFITRTPKESTATMKAVLLTPETVGGTGSLVVWDSLEKVCVDSVILLFILAVTGIP